MSKEVWIYSGFASLKLDLLSRTKIHFCTIKFVTSEVRNTLIQFVYSMGFVSLKFWENRNLKKKFEILKPYLILWHFNDMFTTWFHEQMKNQFRIFTNSLTNNKNESHLFYWLLFSVKQSWMVWKIKKSDSYFKFGENVKVEKI